jgi:hypothetical protein
MRFKGVIYGIILYFVSFIIIRGTLNMEVILWYLLNFNLLKPITGVILIICALIAGIVISKLEDKYVRKNVVVN